MMLKTFGQSAAVSLLGIVLLSGQALGQATTFAPDQKIEVREGDEWSNATVVKREGRKYQIKYEDGTEEWVTADRLRATGAGDAGDAAKPADGAGSAPNAATPAKPSAPKGPPQPSFPVSNGMKLESKWGGSWREAVVKQKSANGWILVNYTPGPFLEWVEPWRLRKIGDKTDAIPYARPNDTLHKPEPPPKQAPGEKPAEEKRNDPFAPKAYDKPVTDAKIDNAEDILPTGGAKALTQFDAIPETPKLQERAYVLRGKQERGSGGPADVLFAGTRAMAVYTSGHGGDAKTAQVETIDLAGGKNMGTSEFDPLSNPIAMSASGKRVLGRAHGFFGGTRNRVDLFDVPTSGAPKHVISFVPYLPQSDTGKSGVDVDWAAFLDDDHILTCSNGGMLVLWDAPKATATWRVPVLGRAMPALSPGGKQLAVMTSDGLVILDPLTGKALCSIDGSRQVDSLSFTPDGKRVVGSTGTIISSWDLEKGEMAGDIGMPMNGARGNVVAASPTTVLVGGTDLLDLERKCVIWRYMGAGAADGASAFGGRCWAIVRDGDRTLLTAASLPHPAAEQAARTVGVQSLLVKPGDTVSLEVAIEGTPEQQKKIADAITAQLRRNGIGVAAGQPVKLIARTEQGKTESRTYERRNFGGFGPPSRETETVSVTEKITRIYFEANGQVAWENRTVSTAPWMVNSKQGESIGSAVNAASSFNLQFLESVRVPVYVPQPAETVGFGQSRWSMGGVKDDR